jgi:hypothetical protein
LKSLSYLCETFDNHRIQISLSVINRVRLLKKKFTKKFDKLKSLSYLCKPITKRLTLL